MTFEQILKELKAKKYHPVYFLHGAEPYFIDQLSDHFEHEVLDENEKSFNLTILYGKEVDHKVVVDSARRYPMMAPYQVVILKEAQAMKQLSNLDSYLKHPAESTLLVICYKHARLDKRTKFAKTILKHCLVFESKKLYDNQMPAWIEQYLQKKKFKIEGRDSALIAEYLGNDLSKVANELDKLALNLPKGQLIKREDIETHIGISKDYNIFELQNALGNRNVEKTYRIIKYFQANPKGNPLIAIVGGLFSFFSKIYQMHALHHASDREIQQALGISSTYFVKDYRRSARNYNQVQTEKIIELLRIYDLKAKGVERANFTDPALMHEMIYHILAS